MKIRIKKCSLGCRGWYKRKIGSVYRVISESVNIYFVDNGNEKMGFGLVLKKDAETVDG